MLLGDALGLGINGIWWGIVISVWVGVFVSITFVRHEMSLLKQRLDII